MAEKFHCCVDEMQFCAAEVLRMLTQSELAGRTTLLCKGSAADDEGIVSANTFRVPLLMFVVRLLFIDLGVGHDSHEWLCSRFCKW